MAEPTPRLIGEIEAEMGEAVAEQPVEREAPPPLPSVVHIQPVEDLGPLQKPPPPVAPAA